MNLRRIAKLSVDKGVITSYIHGGGRIGVLVKLACEKEDAKLAEIAKDVAMQVAATNPLFLNRDGVDTDTLEKKRNIQSSSFKRRKARKVVEKWLWEELINIIKKTV